MSDKLHELQEAVADSLLAQVRACKDAEPKQAAALLKVAAEYLRQNHVEQPKPPQGSDMEKLAKELAEIPSEWDEVHLA